MFYDFWPGLSFEELKKLKSWSLFHSSLSPSPSPSPFRFPFPFPALPFPLPFLRFLRLCHVASRLIQTFDSGHVKAVVLHNLEKHFSVGVCCRLRVCHLVHESRNRQALAAIQPRPFLCRPPSRYCWNFTHFFQVHRCLSIAKSRSGKFSGRWALAATFALEKVLISKGEFQAITLSGERDGQCPTANAVQRRCKNSSKSSSEVIGRTTSLHWRKHLKVCTTATTGTETKNVNYQGKINFGLTAIHVNGGWRQLRWHRQRGKPAEIHPRKNRSWSTCLVTQTKVYHFFPKRLENVKVFPNIRLFAETKDTNPPFNRWHDNQNAVRAIRKQCVYSLLGLSLHAYDNVSREGVNLEMCIKIMNLKISPLPHESEVQRSQKTFRSPPWR